MTHFEIHGDDENGVTVRWGGRTMVFDLCNVRDVTRIDTTHFAMSGTYTSRLRRPISLELDLLMRPEVPDATMPSSKESE